MPHLISSMLLSRQVHQGLNRCRNMVHKNLSVTQRRPIFRVRNSNNNESSKYSSSEDDVVGFGRVIRDPRKSKAEVLRESLGGDKASSIQELGSKKSIRPTILTNNGDRREWDELDQHVNEYPGERSFKAIGFGGDDFVKSMRDCVESVLGEINDAVVQTKESSGGNYISVSFGPVLVESPEQIKDIYSRMQQDGRMKFFL